MKPFLASLRAAVALHKRLESSGGAPDAPATAPPPTGAGEEAGATGGSDADCESSPTVAGTKSVTGGDVNSNALESATLSPCYSNSSLATTGTSLSRQASKYDCLIDINSCLKNE